MTFFEHILSPFIFIIKQVFLFSYDLTGNYGIAIILLSFAISSLLLPVFIFIEKAKKKDDIIKNKMKPLIEEIKRVYKGQERFYYIKTINRQHNYNSLKALIPILSLLIQIPFFIAAYQFLEGFEPLKGVSFVFIPDLSKPDGLFGLINILPIIMTLVNILTAYYYTRNGNITELKQMLILAAAFLVLLFNLPSGLVLYWTINNVFSFLRLFITNPEVFKKETISKEKSVLFPNYKSLFPKLIKVFNYTLITLTFFQLYWAFNHTFDDIVLRLLAALVVSLMLALITGVFILLLNKYRKDILQIEVKPIVFFSLLFLSIYYYLASKYYFTGVNSDLSLLAILTLLPLQFIGYIYFYRNRIALSNLISTLLFLLLASQLLNLFSIISSSPTSLSFLNISIKTDGSAYLSFIGAGILFSLITVYYYQKSNNLNSINSNKPSFLIYLLSVLYITGLIFYWNPLAVFSSFPAAFKFTGIEILKTNSSLFAISILSGIAIYFILSHKLKKILVFVVFFVAISSFIYNSIIPINLGTLQMHRFSNIDNLAKPIYFYIIEGFLLILIFVFIQRILKQINYSKVIIALILLNLATISQSVYLVSKTGELLTTKREDTNVNKQETIGQHYNGKQDESNYISLSQNKKNVVVIVLDMFQGWYLRQILTDNPELKQTFNGFTWYPNTISVSNYTSSSAPSILAGKNYTPDKLNEDSLHTLGEKVTISNDLLREKAQRNSFHFICNNIPYSKSNTDKYDSHIPDWSDKWENVKPILNIGINRELEYTILWQNSLFFSLPLFVKPSIYNNGKWILPKRESNENTKLSLNYNLLRVLPYISNNKAAEASFVFLWSNATHFPWDIVDDSSNLISNVGPYRNNEWAISKVAIWINWMKNNNVYDNTKIIILSDHGIRDTKVNDSIMIENPFTPEISENLPLSDLLNFTPLMMVKDYDSKGEIIENMKFLSNIDTYDIAFEKDNITNNDSIKNDILEAYLVSWELKRSQLKMPIIKKYTVKRNVYNLDNWTRIE